jgi:hypothetical protein
MPIPQAQYKAMLYSPAGEQVAEFENWQNLSMTHKVNDVDSATITLYGNDSRYDLFEDNCSLEVWRRIPGYLPRAVPTDRLQSGQWYCEWEGLHVDYDDSTDSSGQRRFISSCVGYLDFLSRREVLWYSGTDGSKKGPMPLQQAMAEFVNENAGSAAVAAGGRLINGHIQGLSVGGGSGGPTWYGARAWRNLLEVIQGIAAYGNADFDIIGQGNANWQFQSYVDRIGVDRTTYGLNRVTGLNAAGFAPVVFSLESQNVASIRKKSFNRKRANVVAALGKGEGTNRMTRLAVHYDTLDTERRNQREITRNASTQDTGPELQAVADAIKNESNIDDDISFEPLIVESCIYGVHYWWTDRITANYQGETRHKRLTEVSIDVDANGERFSAWKFETQPRVA